MSTEDTAATVTMPAAGEDTEAFTPDWTESGEPEPGRHAGPVRDVCGCGTSACPDSPRPETDEKGAVLSCAPGVVTRMFRERIRNGQWENIPAYVRDRANDVQKYAVEHLASIRLDLERGVLDLAPVFDRVPALHADPDLAERLRCAVADVERQLVRQQGDMHREVLRRIAVLRSDLEERGAESAVAA